MDIDEAGYLSIALNDYGCLVHTGLLGWLSAIEVRNIQPPLTMALASLVFVFTGPHVIAGFVVPLLAGACCIVTTYFLGKSVSCPQVGMLASVLIASCPVIINYSRSFNFALIATLVMTLCLLALVRSDRFDKANWVGLFGLTLGLLPLARTMTVAFIPGIVAGAFVHVIVEPGHLLRRVLMLFASFQSVPSNCLGH